MELIVIIVVLFLIFGGGYVGHRTWGPTGGIGIGGVLLVLFLLWLFLGHGVR